MKFYIQYDGRGRSRAYSGTYGFKPFSSVNAAIDALKTKKSPHKLVFEENGAVYTILYYSGKEDVYTAMKLNSLHQVGPLMFVPRSLVRKTTRKRKKKCKK